MSGNDEGVKLVRIVPPEGSGARLSVGTKVLLPNGSAIPGITNLTIHVRPDDVWRATIDVDIEPTELPGVVAHAKANCLSWWRRALVRLAGIDAIDVTNLDSQAKEFRSIRLLRGAA